MIWWWRFYLLIFLFVSTVLKKKLREATYTAAVCKFRGGHFFVFCLVPSVAQLSSASFYFLCFPAAAYVHLDAWCDPYCIVEVDNFLFGLFPSVAQLSSTFHYFSCFPAMVSTIFCLRGAYRPRPQWRWYFWSIRGLENVTRQNERMTEWQNDGHFDIMTTNALRAAAVKINLRFISAENL